MSMIVRACTVAIVASTSFGALSGCVVRETTVASPPPAAAAAAPAPAPAPTPVPASSHSHPAYLHALTDLRYARANLVRRGGDAEMKWDEREAVEAIDRAIAEIKQAAINDGKDLDDHPPVDLKEPRAGRLHKALATLRKAHGDIAREEDNAFARGLRDRALGQIDAAMKHTEKGIQAFERGA